MFPSKDNAFQTKNIHILDTNDKRIKSLKFFGLSDIWGIGRRLSRRLENIGCNNADSYLVGSKSLRIYR